MRSAGRPRLFLVALLVAGVLLAPAGASGQSREELEQVRRELAAKYAAAEAELAKLVAELPEVTDDEAELEQKRAYVDRIFALRGDLEILKSDLEFLDFRLGETTEAAGAGALEGTVYVLSKVLDKEGRPLEQAGMVETRKAYDQSSIAFDVPNRITIGQPVRFGASVVHSFDCRRKWKHHLEMLNRVKEEGGLYPGWLGPGSAQASVTIEVQYAATRDGGEKIPDVWITPTNYSECDHDPETKEEWGVLTPRASLDVEWTPSPVSGSERYRYSVRKTSDGADSLDAGEIWLDRTELIVVTVSGAGLRAGFFYSIDPEAEPAILADFEHPELPGDDAGAEETLASSDREGATAPPAERSRFIDEWLAVAEPPQNATDGADLRYDPWGRVEGTTPTGTITLSGPPETAAGSSHEHVWAHRHRLDSVDHCTLGEFVEARLAGESIAGCRGRHRRTAVPDVVGLRVGEAAARLSDAGFSPGATAGGSAPSPELAGTVASVGEPRGDRVELVVYTEAVPDVAVPDLSRMPLGRAAERLGAEGLSLEPELGEAAPSSELAGQIYHQEPASATRVADGSTVRVRVYGEFVPPTVPVPDVDGLGLSAAKSRLAETGLSMAPALGEPAPRRQLASRIYRQDPAAGSPLAPGEPVRVRVYDAFVPPTAAVPDVDGLGLREAGSRLEAEGFAMEPALGEPAPRAASEDRVYRQEPAAGEALDKGNSVRVWVHSGVAAVASSDEPVTSAAPASEPRPIDEIIVPARIGKFALEYVYFYDVSEWGRGDLSKRWLDVGSRLRSSKFSRQGDSYRIPRPGDRWPFGSIWDGCVHTDPYCWRVPVRFQIHYKKEDPHWMAQFQDFKVLVMWLSPGLVGRSQEYSHWSYLITSQVKACTSEAQEAFSKWQGKASMGKFASITFVSSRKRVAYVLVAHDPDQAGMKPEFEAVARRLLEQIEKGALECTR